MRTTLTFEDDVAALIKREMARRGAGLKQVINEALRLALTHDAPRKRRKRFKQRTWDLGGFLAPIDNAWEAVAIAEGETFK